MQVVEKSSQGLSRVLQVVIPASDLGAKLESKIAEVAPRVNLKGFRPGKVPVAHVRKMFARDLMGEIVQDALNESSQKALDDAKLRPASQPELKPVSDLNKVVAGEEDLSYEIELEVMPEFEPVDVATLELKRPTYEAQDADVQEALDQLLSQSKTYEAKGGKAPKAAEGDQLLIDFVGKIDGEAFPGGTATDAELVIGSGQFIPGFEDQLVGAKKGEERVLNVTFPENYGAAHLAGKAATFDVTVKEIRAAKDAEADDAFAERLGFENLDALKNALKVQLDQQYGQASRFKTKRALLDILDAKHAFDLPAKMVDAEFQGIWAQVDSDRQGGRLPPEDADKSEEQLRDEYRKIAERRVRLGLVLAEIGRANNVVVTDQELAGAIAQEARRYPGQERQVFEFYQKNQQLAAQLRAPIYEEKVVDLILSKAKVENEAISKEALFEDEELDLG